MAGEDLYSWSVTADNNGNSDSTIRWQEGQTRASVNNSSRSEMAAHAKHNKLTDGSITTTNTANAYAFTSGIGYTAVPTGMRVKLKTNALNTGSSTLNMDGIGDVTILTDQGVTLKGGELVANAYTDLLYNGTNWIFLYSETFFFNLITNGDGIIIANQIFKVPGTFTYTPTSDLVQCVIVECIGGGGAGGGAWGTIPGTHFQGGGGGGGGYSRKLLTKAEIGVSQPVVVGAGGAPFAGNGPPGAASRFGTTLCVANGGGGGIWGTMESNPQPGAGGALGTGDVTVAGTAGGFGWYGSNTTSSYTLAGHGGSGPLGSYGTGGNGGSVFNASPSTFVAGGAGTGGMVIVTEFGGRGLPGRDGADGAPGPTGPMGPPGAAGAGTGDVLVSGVPVAGQVAQWTDTSHIRGVDLATLNFFSTGDIKPTFKTTPDTGWVMLDDRTIGSAASGATNRANTDTLALYTLLWNNCSNADAPVSGGRGASAAIDFGANKTLTLPKALGRAMMSAGTGASLTARALGVAVGEERHTQTAAEMAAHTHTSSSSIIVSSASGLLMGLAAGSDFSSYQGTTYGTITTTSQGSGTPFNVMQPSFAVNFMCKL